MSETKKAPIAGSTDDELSATTIFELLANDRRRLAIQYLRRAVGAVPVSELGDYLSLAEGEHTADRYERICTGLVHLHIPKLESEGILAYDPELETVELLDAAAALDPYLDLATPVERA